MEFNIAQKDFYKTIQNVKNAVSTKNTLPVIQGILIETTEDQKLHLIGTDLELGIETWVKADIIDTGKIVVPASQLFKIVRELPKKPVNFKVNENNFTVNIKCADSKFKLKCFNPEEFPELPEVKSSTHFTLSGIELKQMIKETVFCTLQGESQPALTGVMTEINKNTIKMISTNTYRLALCELENDNNTEKEIEMLIPGVTLKEVKNLINDDENINIKPGNNYVKFKLENINIISRLIEGDFPNYNQVIPDDYNTKIIVDTKKLKKAVKRVSLIAKLDSNIIVLEIKDDKMVIDSLNSEEGHAHETVDIKTEGPEQIINIDAKYLIDILKILNKEKLEINFIDSVNPMMIKLKEKRKFIYIIMPVRPG